MGFELQKIAKSCNSDFGSKKKTNQNKLGQFLKTQKEAKMNKIAFSENLEIERCGINNCCYELQNHA
jgi:hypothetical protein